MTTTLVALYDNVRTAQQVVDALLNRGFDRDNISLIARDVDEEYAAYVDGDNNAGEVAEGAGIGAIIGGIGGLLVGLGALAIPGIGPVIAAGPIVAGLTGAGVGAVAGGIVGALVDMGIPEEEAHHYAEGIRRGGTMVTAQVADEQMNEAIDIMEQYHPVNLNQRAASWREAGWNRFSPETQPMTRADIDREYERYGTNIAGDGWNRTERTETARPVAHDEEEVAIPIVDEEVRVGKRQVERGGVRVRTYVVEQPVEEQVALEETRVKVERRPVNRPASDADFDAFEEGTIEMTETAEELVVDKQARVTEEVRISKERQQHTETVHETARHTEVEVEEVGAGGFDGNYRRHYDTTYASSGNAYDHYAPAYRYGYNLAGNERFHNRSWDEIEPEVRRDWANRYERERGLAWNDVSDAVRHGWTQVSTTGHQEPEFRRNYETSVEDRSRR